MEWLCSAILLTISRNDFYMSKRQDGRSSVKTVLRRRILALISYASKGCDKEKPLLEDGSTVKTKVLTSADLMISGLSQELNLAFHNRLLEDLLQMAQS